MSSFSASPTTTWTAPPCRYCGAWHTGMCPRVRAIDYFPDGSVKRVELFERDRTGASKQDGVV